MRLLPWSRKSSSSDTNASQAGQPSQSQPNAGGAVAPERPPEFDVDYVNEEHLAVFERALNTEDTSEEPAVEHIRSVSDFAPIRERVRKATSSKKRRRGDVVREGWAYHVSRWPLLVRRSYSYAPP
jgi:hypothetical protein